MYNGLDIASEQQYFNDILDLIATLLDEAEKTKATRQTDFDRLRQDAKDDYSTSIDKEDRMMSIAQYLSPLALEAATLESAEQRIMQLRAAALKPYFARVDFYRTDSESSSETGRSFYIGRFSIRDRRRIKVFDWRAPVSALFYRYGVGPAGYTAPNGYVNGHINVKRQYEINDSQLDYFFDSDLQINDELLRRILSRNTSAGMKTIIETIQRDQDDVIRDVRSDLLMVQGAAGSGKTSIALHRAAYLMYEGLANKLASHDIAILSPNRLFEKYISGVLPELGERNAASFVFDDLIDIVFDGELEYQSRIDELESMINGETDLDEVYYKNSPEFVEQLIEYAHSITPDYKDVVYLGKTLFTAEELRGIMSEMEPETRLAVRLEKLEQIILEKVRKLRGARIRELEREAALLPEHATETEEYARMRSIVESTELILFIRTFTKLDYIDLYYTAPVTRNLTQRSTRAYSDAVGITLLKLLLEPCNKFVRSRQLVIDEAQDYNRVHYEIIKRLFVNARYTVLGDVNQTIMNKSDMSLYEQIERTFDVKSSHLVKLELSFRSTSEILDYSSNIIGIEIKSIDRRGASPEHKLCITEKEYLDAIVNEVKYCESEGYGSIALICESEAATRRLHDSLSVALEVNKLDVRSPSLRGVLITPVYMAKGLEFDAVLVCGDFADKNMLFVACTRALHRLNQFGMES